MSDRTGYEQHRPGYSYEEFPEPERRPGRRGPSKGTVVLIVSGVLVVAAVVAICLPLLRREERPATLGAPAPTATSSSTTTTTTAAAAAGPVTFASAKEAGAAFLQLWQAGDYAGMQRLVSADTPNLAGVYGTMDARLGVTRRVITPGAVDRYDNVAFTAKLTLKELGDFTYQGSVKTMPDAAGAWVVDWHADAIHPDLGFGQRLELGDGGGARGEILDRKGRPLSSNRQLSGKVVGSFSASGSTGLQDDLGDELAGKPVKAVVIRDSGTGKVVETLMAGAGGAEGKAVRTTLDLDLQAAAEAALAGVGSRAAIVAMDTRNGSVLALADVNGGGLPASLLAQEPPGSTFKIVTATAALMNGKSAATKVPCTTTITVNGKTFKNHEKNASREMTLTEAFADSCNTAFIALERTLPDDALLKAADVFGFGIDQPLPVGSTGGHLPAPDGSVEAAADAIGQGRVLASPLQMASVAAGVASGTWHQPRLLTSCDCASNPVPGAAQLRSMMRAVVTSGTGTVMAGVPGGKVYAKTGTAEFGDGSQTHAWFVGWQGTVAFAAYVEVGQSGGATAAPLIKKFLARI